MAIDNNIIQSLGGGSGIDTRNLVNQLVAIERSAPQERIDTQRLDAQTQLSDFGLLSSALANLQSAAQSLAEPEALFSKTASFTDSTSLVPTELDTDVPIGSYNFSVEQIAQAQAVAFDGFTSTADTIGLGTLTINFGSYTRTDPSGDPPDFTPTGFTQNGDITPINVEIDLTNNTLEGLRDEINEAAGDTGLTASIVFDGTDFHLSLLSPSGESNQIEVVVEEGASAAENIDDAGLSLFAFGTQKPSSLALETQIGLDAEITVNGLSVSRSTNTIDDVIDGLTFDVLEPSDGQIINISVIDDRAFAEQNIRDFVTAYNDFIEATQPLFGVSEQENADGVVEDVRGSLANDGLARSVLSQVRNLVSSEIQGLSQDSVFTSLATLGIATERGGGGRLEIVEDRFREAFDENFEAIQRLLAPSLESSNPNITPNSTNDSTQPGEYVVDVTTAPTPGAYQGIDVGTTFPLDTSALDLSFSITVDGTESGLITVPPANYDTFTDFVAALRTSINSDEALQDAGLSVNVAFENNQFTVISSSFGSNSSINFSNTSADLESAIGISDTAGTNFQGVAPAGTIDGTAAFASGSVLLPEIGQPGQGLALIIGGSTPTSGTVNFSLGFAGELDRLIDSLLDPNSGIISQREDTISRGVSALDDDQLALDRRIESFEERLIRQFIASERIIASLNSSSTFVENLIDTLPFTSGDN